MFVDITSNDGDLFGSPKKTLEAFEKEVCENYKKYAAELLAAYPHATAAETSRSTHNLLCDALFGTSSWA